MTYDHEAWAARDAEGRPYGAPAWSGSLADLDANQLNERADKLGNFIGLITTKFQVRNNRYEVDIDVAKIRMWASRRADCLNELERRADRAGVRSLDLVFAAPSWKAREAAL